MPRNSALYDLMTTNWLMDSQYVRQLVWNALNPSQQESSFKKKIVFAVDKNADTDATVQALIVLDENNRCVDYINNEIPEGSTAVIDAVGPMTKYGGYFNWGADEIVARLDYVNNQKNISAIVINIDGPGGAVAAIPPFIEFAARKQKPVVALCDLSASLHYWIPNAIADHIMASNTISARFGSVGVVTSWMDLKEYFNKMGVKMQEVYPPESSHKNEVWRMMEEDEDKGKQLLIERQLTGLAKKFQDAVKTNRPQLKADEEGVLSGRLFGAEEALQLGMIDSIGTLTDAINVAQMLAESQNVRIY